MPVTLGMVARACASFEVGSLVFVAPRTNPLLRSALRASKGALQHSISSDKLSWRVCDSLDEALAQSTHVVALTRLEDAEDSLSYAGDRLSSRTEVGGREGGGEEGREERGQEGGEEAEERGGGARRMSSTVLQKQRQGLKDLSRTLSSLRQQTAVHGDGGREGGGEHTTEGGGCLALVFGREDTGFTNEELEREDVKGIVTNSQKKVLRVLTFTWLTY
jgi:tRNA G18 (ribose-2'-O)-methylase SpoU